MIRSGLVLRPGFKSLDPDQILLFFHDLNAASNALNINKNDSNPKFRVES